MNGTTVSPTIAIIGSGPSGCYTAQFLRKRWPDAEIVVFDRLAAPYGLIRYGVAPDHVGTKNVARQFERLFTRDRVRFVGETTIGTGPDADIELGALRDAFDAVVLATGLHADRALDGLAVPFGGVHGSGALTRLINSHPEERLDTLRIGRRVVIVGAGNVAVDLVRLLLTSPEQLAAVGVADDVVAALTSGPVETIDVVARGPLDGVKADPTMLRELGRSSDVRFALESSEVSPPEPAAAADADGAVADRVEALLGLVASSPSEAGRVVTFRAGWTPVAVDGEHHVEGVRFRSTADDARSLDLEADTVLTAIGFTESDTAPLQRDALASELADLERGLLAGGLYCVGWLRRGPVGTIPANRADARMVADVVIADLESRGVAPRAVTTKENS